MHSEENEKIAQIIKWIRQGDTRLIWDILCGDSWFSLTVGDYIEIMEQTVEEGMYEYVLVLITKLSKCKYMNEAITNVIIKRINGPSLEFGVITECIKEFKNIAIQYGIMEKNIEE